MANFVYNQAKKRLIDGTIDLDTNTIKAMLLMTNTTAASNLTAVFVGDIVTPDEFDGANYTAGGATLANKAVNVDVGNNRAEFDADDVAYVNLGAGTRQVKAVLIYKYVTNAADSPVIAYIDTGTNLPATPNGGNFQITWNAEGIIQLA